MMPEGCVDVTGYLTAFNALRSALGILGIGLTIISIKLLAARFGKNV